VGAAANIGWCPCGVCGELINYGAKTKYDRICDACKITRHLNHIRASLNEFACDFKYCGVDGPCENCTLIKSIKIRANKIIRMLAKKGKGKK